MARKQGSRQAARINEWAVTVRLNDGRVLFWWGEESKRLGQDWGAENRAFRFAREAEADIFAAECATNSKAWEYRTVRLPQPR